MRGKIGEKLNEGKKNEGEINQMMGKEKKINSPTLSHLLTVT